MVEDFHQKCKKAPVVPGPWAQVGSGLLVGALCGVNQVLADFTLELLPHGLHGGTPGGLLLLVSGTTSAFLSAMTLSRNDRASWNAALLP